ncbi:hypothetical protein [Acidisoma cladoniae]|uniref:hypothetical protein n=1 Tax=Acidisoma cladoniae TaxID=3040935 RepID=UPI00254EA0EF|nr:hypothetical protein [Acidisoma sp. PAMC 29798]
MKTHRLRGISPHGVLRTVRKTKKNGLNLFMWIIQTLSLIVTVFIAVWLWRLQVVGKRKFEVAEQVLVAAQTVADVLMSIRAPFASSSETQDALEWHGRTDELQGNQKYALVVLHRIDRGKEYFNALKQAATIAKYLISEATGRAANELFHARSDIIASATVCARDSQVPLDRMLMASFSERDEFHMKVAKTMEKIELECAPLLNAWINPFPIRRWRKWLLAQLPKRRP